MKNNNITLYVPTLDDYWYEQKLLSDVETMYYNAGYDFNIEGYDYSTGCIDFPKEKWEEKFNSRDGIHNYMALIKDGDEFVGYTSYYYNGDRKYYEGGVLIEADKRDRGYAKPALKLMLEVAKNNGIKELYCNFEDGRGSLYNIFTEVGFQFVEKYNWVRFNYETKGVLVKCNL